MKRVVCLMFVGLVAVAALSAQEGASPVTFQVGAGFTTGVGRTGASVNTGWNTSGGVGYNFGSMFGAMLDINTSVLGVNSNGLGLGAPGGHVTVFAATLDPILHLGHHGRTDVYVTGGGGLYRTSFSPAISSFTEISSYSTNKPGMDVGVGFAIGSASRRGKVFAEARYNRIFNNDNFYTNYLPVTFGYRW